MTRKAQKKLHSDRPKKPRSEKQIAAQFKKGNKANPIGGLAHDPWKREVKKLTSQALAEITEMVCGMSIEEVEVLVQSKKLTLAQKTILRATLDASENGEIDKFNTIVSRAVGQIPTQVQITSPDGSMSPSRATLSPEELKAAINEKLDQIEAAKK
jgi:hypothetical protein